MWQIINSEAREAQDLMDLDKYFLETLNQPTLHFYRFKNPSLTYGLLMNPEEHLHTEVLRSLGINLGKRPTGGGALFHLWDLAFSVIIPLEFIPHITGTLERYFCLNQLTQQAIEPFITKNLNNQLLDKTPDFANGERFCMAKPTQYDVMIEGKKCVGAAQRVTKKNLLHQATISLCPPEMDLLRQVLKDENVTRLMQSNSFSLGEFSYLEKTRLQELQSEVEKSLEETFQKNFRNVFVKK
jgi:lipoate---protein ligase